MKDKKIINETIEESAIKFIKNYRNGNSSFSIYNLNEDYETAVNTLEKSVKALIICDKAIDLMRKNRVNVSKYIRQARLEFKNERH